MTPVSNNRDPAFTAFLKLLMINKYRQLYFMQNAFTSSVDAVLTFMRAGELSKQPLFDVDSRGSPFSPTVSQWTKCIHHREQGWSLYYQHNGQQLPSVDETRKLYNIPEDQVLIPCVFDDVGVGCLILDPEEFFMGLTHGY